MTLKNLNLATLIGISYQIFHSHTIIWTMRFDEFGDQGSFDLSVLGIDGRASFIELTRR